MRMDGVEAVLSIARSVLIEVISSRKSSIMLGIGDGVVVGLDVVVVVAVVVPTKLPYSS